MIEEACILFEAAVVPLDAPSLDIEAIRDLLRQTDEFIGSSERLNSAELMALNGATEDIPAR